MIASLSHLEALYLNVTSDALDNCFIKIKKAKSSVVNKDAYQRETLTKQSDPFDCP